MIAIVRTRTLHALRARVSEAETARVEAERCLEQSGNLRVVLDRAIADAARLDGELETLRAQSLLDTEDRQALRTLLRIARKQAARADRVYVLFHFGELHSVHATQDAAEIAAEAEGAPRDGWASPATCCGGAPARASEVPWRIRTLPLGGTR
ncbi:hypothetical protein [Streptomyces sp. NPDC002785]|uniref:hypothetical protein n=1 Tax=Streptomyces sp. NPDC002785 TaxID=3154543 RepID=UPI003324AAFB